MMYLTRLNGLDSTAPETNLLLPLRREAGKDDEVILLK